MSLNQTLNTTAYLCLLLWCLQAVTAAQRSVIPDDPQLVLFDHDGGVDDFITLLLLLSNQQHAELIGITIVDGDCHVDVAANTTLKLLHLLGHSEVPVALSTLPAVNPFPSRYRSQGLILDVLPMLNRLQQPELADLRRRQLQKQTGQEYFAQLLLQQQRKTTIIATGPLSNLAYALRQYPQVADKIEHVWWMGGALRVRGNVYEAGTDGSAEWNAYWDPASMGVVWASNVPLTLVPLDGTNKVPITPDLIYSFGPQADNLYSALAGTMYAPVVNWVLNTPGDPYYAWDALTAACMMDPMLCKVERGLEVAAVLSGPAQGATVLIRQHQDARGPQLQQQPTAYTAAMPRQRCCPAQVLHEQHGTETAHLERVLLSQPPEPVAGSSSSSSSPPQAVRGPAAASLPWGPVVSVQGTDVTKQLSAVKVVSAVMDVDAQAFQRFMLTRLAQ